MQGGGLFLIADAWAAAHPDRIADAVAASGSRSNGFANSKEAPAIESQFLNVEPRIVELSFKG